MLLLHDHHYRERTSRQLRIGCIRIRNTTPQQFCRQLLTHNARDRQVSGADIVYTNSWVPYSISVDEKVRSNVKGH